MTIVCGIDAHDKELVCRIWRSDRFEETKRARNTDAGRKGLWAYLARMRADVGGAEEVIVGYEACGLGYTIFDEASEAGFLCYVLATIKMPKSPMDGKRKTDEYDAQKICEVLRAHELAGLSLPTVWIPSKAVRDDRELIRRRFDVKSDSTRIKNQIHALLKRQGIKRPEDIGNPWTKPFMAWLKVLVLAPGARAHLTSLIHQHESLAENVKALDSAVEKLSKSDRYSLQVEALVDLKGVGTLTAMLFLSELGDLDRFPNRGAIKSYVGLAPSSHESGEIKDRKGHITRNGSSRLRAILNQAVWVRLTCDTEERVWFEGYLATHSGGKRKAVVVCMARLVQLMWHRALEAQHEYERGVA
jgi:transposase